MNKNLKTDFSKKLLKWFAQNHRAMPWKGEKNPYLIWLSEIILQQTRVEQGWPYFLKFKETYPTIQHLADAPEDEVMRLWQGLGYYSRARNLHATAKYISYELNNEFPKTHSNILKLKGVGAYTAAAIASFAYDLPYAVLDGNVYRLLSRYFGIETAIDSTEGKKEFAKLAQELSNKKQIANYNQAIMDFGATLCMPKKPSCSICPFSKTCVAFNMQKSDVLPFKSKKIKKTERFFHYLLINYKDSVYLQKRINKDIWQHLYQFPMIENAKIMTFNEIQKHPYWQKIFEKETIETLIITQSDVYKQTLTHQKIHAVFYEVNFNMKIDLTFLEEKAFVLVRKTDLNKFGFPKIIDLFLKDKTLSLKLF